MRQPQERLDGLVLLETRINIPYLYTKAFTMRNLLLAVLFLMASCKSQDCICTLIYSPVCGTNGQEYSNPCLADCEGVAYTDGKCPQRDEFMVLFTGEVGADGCDWVLEKDSTWYHPVGLDSSYYQDSLILDIQYREQLDFFTCGFAQQNLPKLEVLGIYP